MSDRKLAAAIYVGCVLVYALVAGQRLLAPSNDTHFVYQAECFLKHRLDLGRTPPHDNDWAQVETLTLRDGSQLAGQFLRQSPDRFRLLNGRTRVVSQADIAERSRRYFVSFPPFPAVLMLPVVAIFGHRTNDVLFTVLLAGIAPALLFLLLRRLPSHLAGPASGSATSAAGARPAPYDLKSSLWLTGLFAFGSVYFFSAVLGQVWFTAHIVSLALCAIYLWALYAGPRPIIAGLCLGGMFLTRPQMAALLPLFVIEVLRRQHPQAVYPRSLAEVWAILTGAPLRKIPASVDGSPQPERPTRRGSPWPALWAFGTSSGLLAGLGLWHNYLRFGRALEFGHSYLTTIQADNIQRFGLINYQYLSRNLATALTLLPKLLPTTPYLQISYHGLALWFTTPALLFLLWPERSPAPLTGPADAADANDPPDEDQSQRAARIFVHTLALCCVPIALFALLYQNTGYVQFGYRFSLDYMLPLVLLLALTQGRMLGGPVTYRQRLFYVCVVWGVLVNLFGALTFSRHWQFYFNALFPVA